MKIKTVAVLGAGAVGSYVIWGLSRRKDIRLGVLAEGKRAEKLKKGCTINDEVYHPEVWTPQEAKGIDLLIVSLKYGALPGAMDSIRQVTGENTTVMSLMNGVDSEKLISDEIGASHVIYSVIKLLPIKRKMDIVLTRKPPLVLFSESLAHPMTVNVCRPLRLFCRYRTALSLYRIYQGRNMEQIPAE